VHTQLVLCPGINNGEQLDRSISDLAALYPAVQSVGVVPVGLTKFRRNNHYQIKLDIRPYLPDESAALIEQVTSWQERIRPDLDTNFVYLSDEWYILAGQEMPTAKAYDGYSQLENGVGMVRQLLDESRRVAKKLPEKIERPVRVVVVCGEMPTLTLERALEPLRQVENLDIRLEVVKNTTLGGNVACSGLLFGEEVATALQRYSANGEESADLIFLPRRMFDFSGVRTLDEWTFDKFQEHLGRPVIAAEWTREIWSGVQRLLNGEDCYTRLEPAPRFSQLG